MTISSVPADLLALLTQSQHVLCVSHVNPDGDAYGSVLAMGWMLQHLGKAAVCAMHDPVLEEFRFLPGAESIVGPQAVSGDFDLVITLDLSSPDRMGDVFQVNHHGRLPLAVIDHHVTNTAFGTANWVDASAAATCQMLVTLADVLQVPLQGPLAECLLTGIVTDTLCFRTSNTTPEVMEAAVRLQRSGVLLAPLVQRTLNRMPFRTLRLWAAALANVELADGVLWTVVTQEQIHSLHEGSDDAKLSGVFSNVVEADISAVFTEKIGKNGRPAVECSFRAKPGFSVSEVALALGGGGHPPASGCTVEGTVDAVLARVLPALKRARQEQRARLQDV